MQSLSLIDNSPRAVADRESAQRQERLSYLQLKARRLNALGAVPGHDLDAARRRNAEAIAALESASVPAPSAPLPAPSSKLPPK